MPPRMMGREYWQAECGCGHSRGYHTNDGAGACGGVPQNGKSVPCERRCAAFAEVVRSTVADKLYGPAPVGRPQDFIGKECVHVKVPDVTLLCTGVYAFAEDGNPLCQVEWDGPIDEKTGRRPRLTALHYAGNLDLIDNGPEEVPDATN